MKKIHGFDLVHDSQKMFRLILRAMSNPLKIVNINEYSEKLFGNNKIFLALAMTLLDNEVSFNTCENRELSEEIVSLTLSKRESRENADFIFINDKKDLKEVIESSKCGTLIDPHKSATIVVKITDNKETKLKLSGAGINYFIEILTDATVKEAIEFRDNMFFEYPQGLDFIFACENGDLFSIPRLTKSEVVE
ncbi:MAG TPA: phosphonate C-P lyase system protein PhnH [Ruminiclostridium sp.]